MTGNPQDPIREVPVTEIISPGSSSAPARHSSSPSSDHEHRLPAPPVLPFTQDRAPFSLAHRHRDPARDPRGRNLVLVDSRRSTSPLQHRAGRSRPHHRDCHSHRHSQSGRVGAGGQPSLWQNYPADGGLQFRGHEGPGPGHDRSATVPSEGESGPRIAQERAWQSGESEEHGESAETRTRSYEDPAPAAIRLTGGSRPRRHKLPRRPGPSGGRTGAGGSSGGHIGLSRARSRLYHDLFPGQRHRGVPQRRCRPNRRRQFPNADPLRDRPEPDTDAGGHQRQRIRHRRRGRRKTMPTSAWMPIPSSSSKAP